MGYLGNKLNVFCAEHNNVAFFDDTIAPWWNTDTANIIGGRIKEEQHCNA
jgi:hypothetical protein